MGTRGLMAFTVDGETKATYEDGDELCGSCGERIEDCDEMRDKG